MQETIEFRVPVENAVEHLTPGLGVALGSVKKIELSLEDPLVARIGKLQRQFNSEGRAFFHGWIVHRRYSRRELDEAGLLQVWPKKVFEPAGEECGTIYDDTTACDHVYSPETDWDAGGHGASIPASTCGAGARQVSPLFLDGRRIPKSVDFARTIASEIVVSARVVEVFHERGLIGAEFDRVRLSNRSGTPSDDHFQLRVVGQPVELDPATRAGENPFDEEGYGRCPRGHVVGLNLLSEVTVKRRGVPDADVMVTRQMVGVRRGLLRPRPILLLSPRAWRATEHAQLKGLVVEIARC